MTGPPEMGVQGTMAKTEIMYSNNVETQNSLISAVVKTAQKRKQERVGFFGGAALYKLSGVKS